jgi:TPR repeat protein
MYSAGQGVEQDYEEAVKWYRKAAENGVDYAKEALKSLE